MKIPKLSVALALRERAEKEFKNMVDDLFNKFKSKQTLFKGERKTYTAKEGYLDEPSKRGEQKKQIEMAKNGISKGYSNEIIADLTGLTLEQIEQLRNEAK